MSAPAGRGSDPGSSEGNLLEASVANLRLRLPRRLPLQPITPSIRGRPSAATALAIESLQNRSDRIRRCAALVLLAVDGDYEGGRARSKAVRCANCDIRYAASQRRTTDQSRT
jgi:hypothetical protein